MMVIGDNGFIGDDYADDSLAVDTASDTDHVCIVIVSWWCWWFWCWWLWLPVTQTRCEIMRQKFFSTNSSNSSFSASHCGEPALPANARPPPSGGFFLQILHQNWKYQIMMMMMLMVMLMLMNLSVVARGAQHELPEHQLDARDLPRERWERPRRPHRRPAVSWSPCGSPWWNLWNEADGYDDDICRPATTSPETVRQSWRKATVESPPTESSVSELRVSNR